jgi:hypothetical protein
LQAIADSVETKINPDIDVIFLNSFRPTSANYSGQSKEVFLRNQEFPLILSNMLKKIDPFVIGLRAE